ncbi:MAG: hypothetical protein BWY74_04111 [Firmicutes bacterium ADurb.Bin419]|nr:MAG: hypothetical protein BWY74_04111 [Firmicutes bacterium ADurb.Bin419]
MASEEKILILKMLEEGKINSEEAARLIEAIEPANRGAQSESTSNSSRQQKKVNFSDEVSKVKDKLNEWKKDIRNNYNQKDFDRTIEEFSAKAEKVGRTLATTTIGIADKVVDFVSSFVDTNSFNVFGKFKAVEKSFETGDITEGMTLEVEALNGNILVKKHLDSKVIIKSTVRSPQENIDELLAFSQSEDVISLKNTKDENISVSHEIFLPSIKFKSISLRTKNGKVYVEDSIAELFEAQTSNSNIELMGVSSDKINVTTRNARIQLGYIIGKDIDINTVNSLIDIKHLKTQNLNAVSKNGRILIENVHYYQGCSDINLNLKTIQAGIKVNMNDMEKRGYKIKAQTTNADINLLIPEITYKNISKQLANSFVEAESSGYEGFEQKVNINADTQNGDIEIVK